MKPIAAAAIAAALLATAPGANAIDTCAYTPGAPTVGFPGAAMPIPCGLGGVLTSTPSAILQAVPNVTATTYAAGSSVGGLIQLGAIPFTGGIIQELTAAFAGGAEPTLDIYLFNAKPTASTITDNAPISVAAADVPKLIGVIHITDCASAGASVCQATALAMPYTIPQGQPLYAAVVAQTAITLTSTSDMTLSAQVLD